MKVKMIKQNEIFEIGNMIHCNDKDKSEIHTDIENAIKDIERTNFHDFDDAKEYIYMAMDSVTREYYGEDDLRTFIDYHTEVLG